ncbi:MAG: CBS domain-containing protein [Polyangiaceae bacterium]
MPISKAVGEFVAQDREVPAIAVGDKVAAAVAKMKATSTEGVVVLDGAKLEGVFTERDFLDRVAGAGLDPAETPVADVMTRDPEYLSVLDDIAYAINKMAVGGFRNVPLVDDGKVVAVLNVHDVIGHLFDLFVEVSDRESSELNPWTDVGGG